MVEEAEHIPRFLRLCENPAFPHKEELLRGIESGEYLLDSDSSSEGPSKQIFDIYERRARLLLKRILAKEINGFHAERLLRDTEHFLNELNKVPEEKINFWRFSIDEASSYNAFEGIISERILGCLLTVDRRKVSESDWTRLWGKN